MSEENQEEVVSTVLLREQFCRRCVLRFLGKFTDYRIQFCRDDDEYVVAAKRRKFGRSDELACRACCGILQDQFLELQVLRNPTINEALGFESDTFLIYVNLPISILFRQHAVALELQKKFPRYFTDEKVAQILPLNKAWTLSLCDAVGEIIGKTYYKNSEFVFEFHIGYLADAAEMERVILLRNNLKSNPAFDITLSKSNVDEFVKRVTPEVFSQHFQYSSPARPISSTFMGSVMVRHEPIYIAGRYCKYSRRMGQTPWIIDDVKVMQDSVQDNIFKVIEEIFRADKLIFSASGREDFDVRTLGRGRPFYVRIINPRKTRLSFEDFRRIERDINKCGVVEVRDLQFIEKNLVSVFKEGEELKMKKYRAVCIVYNRDKLPDYVNQINERGPLTIKQITPLRVSHRRTADVREKTIYEMKAWLIDGADDMFELFLVTQAGTYVKEFVHGDFGRTTPCLAEMIQSKVDILALDVLEIDLNFPPAISYDNNENSPDESFAVVEERPADNNTASCTKVVPELCDSTVSEGSSNVVEETPVDNSTASCARVAPELGDSTVCEVSSSNQGVEIHMEVTSDQEEVEDLRPNETIDLPLVPHADEETEDLIGPSNVEEETPADNNTASCAKVAPELSDSTACEVSSSNHGVEIPMEVTSEQEVEDLRPNNNETIDLPLVPRADEETGDLIPNTMEADETASSSHH